MAPSVPAARTKINAVVENISIVSVMHDLGVASSLNDPTPSPISPSLLIPKKSLIQLILSWRFKSRHKSQDQKSSFILRRIFPASEINVWKFTLLAREANRCETDNAYEGFCFRLNRNSNWSNYSTRFIFHMESCNYMWHSGNFIRNVFSETLSNDVVISAPLKIWHIFKLMSELPISTKPLRMWPHAIKSNRFLETFPAKLTCKSFEKARLYFCFIFINSISGRGPPCRCKPCATSFGLELVQVRIGKVV